MMRRITQLRASLREYSTALRYLLGTAADGLWGYFTSRNAS